jgi:GT2 family glycosyltransferase
VLSEPRVARPDELPTPPPGAVVVVHRCRPTPDSPDPRDRRVAARVARVVARIDAPVWLAVTEPVGGEVEVPSLAAAGVTVIDTGVHTRSWLDAHRERLAAWWCTDVATAWWLGAGRRPLGGPPLLLDLDELPSVAAARAPALLEDDETEGRAAAIDALAERDARVLRAAATVFAPDPLADAVRRLSPSTAVEVVAVPRPSPAEGAAVRRHGVLIVGRLVSEPGQADDERVRRFLDEVWPEVVADGQPLLVAALDGAVGRRAVSHRVDGVVGADELWARAARAAAVVLASRDRAVRAAAEASGAPVVDLVGDGGDEPDLVALRHGVEAAIARGIEAEGSIVATPSRARWSRAGTLAAHDDIAEAFGREVFGVRQLPWEQSLLTNLGLDVAARDTWWQAVHHGPGRRAVLRRRAERLAFRPLVSVVVPVHDPSPEVLDATIASVREQLYDRWELVLVDDASTRPDIVAMLDAAAERDARIRLVRLAPGRGIAGATTAGIDAATGAFVAFLDHDDVLAPEALYWVVRRLELQPDLDVVYSDEDKLDAEGRRVEPYFKPDWSPDLLLSCNYITHLVVVRTALLREVGALREGFDGAQDHDLLLRLTERTDRIAHVPALLYSWRKVPGSTAADIDAKPAAHDASRRAVQDAIGRRGLDAELRPGPQPTWHRLRHRVRGDILVSVVIPTRDRVDLLRPCIDLVRSTVEHPHVEIVVVDNESRDPATCAYLDQLEAGGDTVVRYPHRFNFARQINLGVMAARGDVLVLLNNDARPRRGWLDAMLAHAQRPEIGAVGARLFWPDGRAQHEGIVLNVGGVAYNLDSGHRDVYGANVRDCAAVTGACLMMRSAVFHDVGGMDERLRVAYNDVDLCLRIGERGWRVLYTPEAELTHAESSSRGSLHPAIDEAYYQRRWGAPDTALDPFATPNLEVMVPWAPRL